MGSWQDSTVSESQRPGLVGNQGPRVTLRAPASAGADRKGPASNHTRAALLLKTPSALCACSHPGLLLREAFLTHLSASGLSLPSPL